MPPENTATINIPRDVLEPLIQANIAAAVTAALGSNDELISRAIAQVLNSKVDSSGKPSNYSSDITFIQWAMRQAVTKATLEALEVALVGHQDKIKKMLAAEFKKSNSPLVKQLVESFATAITSTDTLKYRLTVSLDDRR